MRFRAGQSVLVDDRDSNGNYVVSIGKLMGRHNGYWTVLLENGVRVRAKRNELRLQG
jgi:hypothetical protein